MWGSFSSPAAVWGAGMVGGWGVGGEVLEASFGPEVSRATSQDRYGLLFSQPAVAIRGSAIWLVTALDG